jgi:Lon protease-like protein
MNRTAQDEISETALANLPIFVLTNMVLFPRVEIPLYVFEPRYRQLLDDVIDHHRLFALALLDDQSEEAFASLAQDGSGHQRPALYPVAGLARIRSAARLPDGRFNIVIEGVGRVDISDEIEDSNADGRYRSARAKLLTTETVIELEELNKEFSSFFGLAHRVLRPLETSRVRFDQPIEGLEEMLRFVDAVGSIALPSAHHRQHLLTSNILEERMQIVSSALAELLIKMSQLGTDRSSWGEA